LFSILQPLANHRFWQDTKNGQKRCVYCGRYYKPDPRARKIQKSCQDAKCRAKRKRESQKRWVEANPDYFKGRYSEVKEWRKKYPDYQRLWRKRTREIQDEIWLVRQCGCGSYVAGRKKVVREQNPIVIAVWFAHPHLVVKTPGITSSRQA